MRRIHLFEFLDLPWYPRTFRRIQTDYLQFAATMGMGHQNLIPLFKKALQHAGISEIVDLCSGGTGPWMRLQEQFKEAGMSVSVTLTDIYPDPEAMQKWEDASSQGIEYLTEPVDAMKVPRYLRVCARSLRDFIISSQHRRGRYCRMRLPTGRRLGSSKPA